MSALGRLAEWWRGRRESWPLIEPAETPIDPANKWGHFVAYYPCWCGDLHYYKPGERDGVNVGDVVVLVGLQGQEWPAVVTALSSIDCDLVVRWTGVHPGLDAESTVCRKHLAEVRVVA